jgi:hypothetical protein
MFGVEAFEAPVIAGSYTATGREVLAVTGIVVRLGKKAREKKIRTRKVTFRTEPIAIISPTEEMQWRFRRIHKMFSCTETCTSNDAAFFQLTVIQQRYSPKGNSEIC